MSIKIINYIAGYNKLNKIRNEFIGSKCINTLKVGERAEYSHGFTVSPQLLVNSKGEVFLQRKGLATTLTK